MVIVLLSMPISKVSMSRDKTGVTIEVLFFRLSPSHNRPFLTRASERQDLP